MYNYTNITTTPPPINNANDDNGSMFNKIMPAIIAASLFTAAYAAYAAFYCIKKRKTSDITQSNTPSEYNESHERMLNQEDSPQETRHHDFISLTLDEEIDPDDINNDIATELVDVDLTSNTRSIKGRSKIITG